MNKPKTLEETLLRFQMVDRRTVAEIFDVTPSQVNELVKRGILPRPVVFSGHLVRWPACWIIQCLENLQKQQQQAAHDKESGV